MTFMLGKIIKKTIELLAPARDVATGIEAVKHGADAVYIGPPGHGARAAAANSVGEIGRLCDFAHRFDAHVYATVNTLIYDGELRDVERMICDLYHVGVDALIVQDMAVLKLDIPPIDLHASTQCDIRTPERALWLASCGFSQLVLPRELTLDETKSIRNAVGTDIVLESFVHGALCVSYSGDCQASCVTTGRSANRGECAQICRLAYDLTDKQGRALMPRRYYLSLRDLDRSRHIDDLIDAGVRSLKIEGRLKDTGYVKNVTAFYSRLLDSIVDKSDGKLVRASSGRSTFNFTPDLRLSFNRGFTDYFTKESRPEKPMGSLDSPKWRGVPVGRVESVSGRTVKARLTSQLANGDGLGYVAADGTYCGFRLNRIEGCRLFAASDLTPVASGTVIYRNRDKVRDDVMAGETAERKINVGLTLRTDSCGRMVIDLVDENGVTVSVADSCTEIPVKAKSDQSEPHRRVLSKTGDTDYRLMDYDDRATGWFVPLSQLTALRRSAFTALDRTRRIRRDIKQRRNIGIITPQLPDVRALTYHDNIANSLALELYKEAGATDIEPALEIVSPEQRRNKSRRVMTTRYCLRRELGSCLRHDKQRKLPDGPLYLKADGQVRFRLDFDCSKCRMYVMTE